MGDRFGPYELLDKIGEGGMAEVWKARATGAAGFQRILVVKKILPMFAKNKAFIDMLVAEAKLCSALHHPNIVPIFDLGVIDGIYYVTMEHVDGVDLLQVLQRAARRQMRVPTEVALFVAGEVARGLAYAHAAVDHEGRPLNIIHRDVSPANVMVGTRGEVKLTDFGVARADLEIETRRGAASIVRHDGLKGKLSYMSPELVSGGEIDHRSDIFAVGTLIYEMLTLKRLFMGKSELQTMANVRKARITRRIERHDYIPRPVQDIIRTALAREPSARYQNAGELYDAIQDYLFEARLRIGPSAVARFVVDLFPERAPRVAPPRVAVAGGRRGDTIEDVPVHGSFDEDLRTERTGRPSLADEDFGEEPSGLKQPPSSLARDEPTDAVTLETEAEAAREPADPVDELLIAIEREMSAQRKGAARRKQRPASGPENDAADDDSDSEDDNDDPAPGPLGTDFRVKGNRDDEEFFGPVTLNTFERLLSNRAISEDEHVSIDGGAWVRIAQSQVRQLSPELFTLPERPVYSGPLRPAWLPRLFHQLSAAGATGMLQLSRGWVRKELHYRDGALLHIQSNIKGELLATIALDLGIVTGDQVSAALNTAKSLGLPVGEGLISVGAIDESRLGGVLREQQRRRFLEIFGWREGAFAFYDGVSMPPVVRPEALDVLTMLGPAVRAHYRLDALRGIFAPHEARVVKLRPAPLMRMGSLGLSPEETAAIEAFEPGWTVSQAIERVADTQDELHLLRAMFLMLALDVMVFADPAPRRV